MSEIQELQSQLPIAQIASQAGVSEDEARQAIAAVLPALVGGMQANAHDPAGAASLEQALGAHSGSLQQRLGGDVDADDGAKIVQNVFGEQTGQIATALGGDGALGQIIRKVLPIVAPIVLAWLAEKFFGNKGGSSSGGGSALPQQAQNQVNQADNPFGKSGSSGDQQATPPAQQRAPQQQTEQSSGGGLEDLLGGILGGKGGGLGDILGDLLGGGRR